MLPVVALLALEVLACVPTTHDVVEDSSSLGAHIPENCPSMIGVYEFKGQAVEGYPNYYRAFGWPLTLDRLLGIPLERTKSPQVKVVEISGRGHLHVAFRATEGEIERRSVGRAQDEVICTERAIVIKQDVQVGGDGTRNWLKITRELAMPDKGALQVVNRITGRGSIFIFFTYELPPEEYRAIFARIEKSEETQKQK